MNLRELHTELQKLGVSQDKYYLHGLFGSTNDSDKIALSLKRGKYTVEYEVYYRERGEKHSSMTFTSETDACAYLLRKIKENQKK